MGVPGVKRKLAARRGTLLLATAALMAFCAAWAGLLPARLVEEVFSRRIYPLISRALAPLAGSVSFSVMDLLLPLALAGLVWVLVRRKFRYLVAVPAAGYLFFFLTWGLNYQRMPLVSRLDFEQARVTDEAVGALREEAAAQLNALFPRKEAADAGEAELDAEARRRVREVVRELDGVNLPTPTVKSSVLLNPIFRAAGTSGMFNPFGQEALIARPLLAVERPVVVMHELAHVLGYANEGEANYIAFVAAIHASDPLSRYSGWMYLWLYLRTRNSDSLLDAGPRADLQTIYDRIRGDEVEWVSRASERTLDTFLRANRVRGGTRSYSEIVRLAVGTRPSWNRFRAAAGDD